MGNNYKRYCFFATELYPESVKPDYINIIESWHIQALLSPLHDRDKTVDGKLKKAHYHLELLYPTGRTEESVRKDVVSIGGVGLEILKSKVGYARYLCHLDNPEKAQYDPKDVKEFGGINYMSLIETKNNNQIYADIIKYIDDCHIKSYAQLLRYAMHFQPTWFEALCKNGIVIKDYLRSNNFDNDSNLIGER